jgi:hypothetical protein
VTLAAESAQPDRRARADDAPDYPNPLPRPQGELERLRAVWEIPKGFRIVTAVNNTVVGYFYIGTRSCSSCWPGSWRC